LDAGSVKIVSMVSKFSYDAAQRFYEMASSSLGGSEPLS
jgi:hypothetical protein